jgi:ABC-type transport system involved in multi-copper enzyme maturation permease subunit
LSITTITVITIAITVVVGVISYSIIDVINTIINQMERVLSTITWNFIEYFKHIMLMVIFMNLISLVVLMKLSAITIKLSDVEFVIVISTILSSSIQIIKSFQMNALVSSTEHLWLLHLLGD